MLGRLAEHNTGCVDWEPYLPVMFARVLKMFNLPVRYNKTSVGGKGTLLDSQTAARWIVNTLGGGSQTQHYLSRLLLSIESFYHPANIGRLVNWFFNLKLLCNIELRHCKNFWTSKISTTDHRRSKRRPNQNLYTTKDSNH